MYGDGQDTSGNKLDVDTSGQKNDGKINRNTAQDRRRRKKEKGMCYNDIRRIFRDRVEWRRFVDAKYPFRVPWGDDDNTLTNGPW